MAVKATSNVAATLDLRTVGNQTASSLVPGVQRLGLPGRVVRLTAQGADCYVAFGPTSAAVGSIAALTAGVNAATGCEMIPQNQTRTFELASDDAANSLPATGPDTWLGYVTQGAGVGFLIISQASP